MLENEFYPTPPAVVDKMLEPYLKTTRWGRTIMPFAQILEPQAGKGDIALRLVNQHNVPRERIYCIEIDQELQFLLQQHKFKVIDSDFLEYAGRYEFDFIIMNPPFSAGVDHLLKAWEVLRNGDIACLLNAETLRNPNTRKRQLLLELIGQHGRYEEIGQPFRTAERPTNVDVAVVWLRKESPELNINFGAAQYEKDFSVSDEEFQANPLAHADLLDSLVAQYNKASDIVVQQHDLQKQYRFYLRGVRNLTGEDEKAPQTLNAKLDELKGMFWEYVFNRTKVGQVTTSDFQKKFRSFTEATGNLAFSRRNIENVLRLFILNREAIMEECLVNIFDQATKFHEKNRVHVEGWKTNKSYKVARKVIMPYGIQWDNYWRSPHRHYDFFLDLDKVMCYLSGRKIEDVTTIYKAINDQTDALNRNRGLNHQAAFYSTFFEIRIFKKGTIHLTFLHEDLWATLNAQAAKGKNWVGPGY